MKKFLSSVPVSLSGVMLSVAALGNLLRSFSETARDICGVIAGLLLILLLAKLIFAGGSVVNELKNPIGASVSGTFSMGLMLLSVYAIPLIGKQAAMVVWFGAITLHLTLMAYFTARFLMHGSLDKVHASYFIVYVGVAAASVFAPPYGMTALGTAIFYFALAAFVVLLIPVSLRYLRHKVPEPARPLFCICAAPASLCLAGYLQSAEAKLPALSGALLAVSLLLYAGALVQLVVCLRLPFYPSYAAFTFPFVISATAARQSVAYFSALGQNLPLLRVVSNFETMLAAAIVAYVLIRFFAAMAKKPEQS